MYKILVLTSDIYQLRQMAILNEEYNRWEARKFYLKYLYFPGVKHFKIGNLENYFK